jgi:hypothetical protein
MMADHPERCHPAPATTRLGPGRAVRAAAEVMDRSLCLAGLAVGVLRRRSRPPLLGADMTIPGLLYIIAVILLVVAALPINTGRISLGLLAAAFALLGYSWDTITGTVS